jgi:hypothetical protein
MAMPFARLVGVPVRISMLMLVLVIVAVPRAVGMNVFIAVHVPVPGAAAFELHFIGAAAACGAHSNFLVRWGQHRPALQSAAWAAGFMLLRVP